MYPICAQTDLISFAPRTEISSAGRLGQSGDGAQQRGLPRAVVAEDHVEAPGGEFSTNAAECGEAAELLDNAVGDDDGRGYRMQIILYSTRGRDATNAEAAKQASCLLRMTGCQSNTRISAPTQGMELIPLRRECAVRVRPGAGGV